MSDRLNARCPACARRPLPRCEPSDGFVGQAWLSTEIRRLLEVVSDDEVTAPRAFEPRGVSLVEIGAECLGHRVVRGIADQGVAKAEAVVVAHGVRAYELLAHESEEVR